MHGSTFKHILRNYLWLTLLATGNIIVANELPDAHVIRTAILKASPSFGATTTTVLPVGKAVSLGPRSGGWQKVTVLPDSKLSGWLRTYQVRSNIKLSQEIVESRTSKRGLLSGLNSFSHSTASLFGKRELEGSSGNITANMGIRGLDEAELENAHPNSEELKQLMGNSVSGKAAKEFARVGGLKSRKVKVLPEKTKKKSKKGDT